MRLFVRAAIHIACFSLTMFATFPNLWSQSGCPGCQTILPADLPADTIYLQSIPAGTKAVYYDQDISFRMPKTTTPVAAVDSTTPSGLTLTKIEILGLDNLPPGLSWEPSQTIFETATQTDGCIKICGTPTVADTFILEVRLKATVFIVTQETSFPLRFVVSPQVSTNDGFSMSNVTGCGSATVDFVNNHPSGGQPGFTYQWDFGDGSTFLGENPPSHAYTQPGIYPVSYQAVIDTAGYTLAGVKVLDVTCVDQLGAGVPDLYLLIKDQNGALIFDSSPFVDNTALPHNFPTDILLGEGNFTLEVWDEDSGLKGSDDLCGSVSFNLLSNDTLISGDFKAVLNIVHPVDEIFSNDTVSIFPQPAQPVIVAPIGLEACAGSDSLILGSNYGAGNQWYRNGQVIAGATDFIFTPSQNGAYQVQFTNTFDCVAISDAVDVVFHALPAEPKFYNNNNRLIISDTTTLPAQYALQWYEFSAPIEGETGFQYCSNHDAEYGLLVTDLATGCSNFFSKNIVYNPNFDCTIGTEDVVENSGFLIYPNPSVESATIQLKNEAKDVQLMVWDVNGRLMQKKNIPNGNTLVSLDCASWSSGIYWVQLVMEDAVLMGKLNKN